MKHFTTPISSQIWDLKYRLKNHDGTILDDTVEDSWRRISKALATVEKDPEHWEKEFYSALEDFKFLPAGRIAAGAGTGRDVTLFNCFVMGTVPDSMDGIMDGLKEAALTMQQGGGIGYDFSTIRPSGAEVKGVSADASGPLSFMDVWDTMCKTIMSAGSRRGAMMATMRCDHPDILDFIEAKKDPLRLRNFNLSVLVTDAFMKAVAADEKWALIFEDQIHSHVEARDLWDRIMQATYDYAEPGVIFIDRINEKNNLRYAETIAATNPCGEQPLPPYGACLLGSINLARLVTDPFGDRVCLDMDELRRVVSLAVRMLDNVVDASKFPLPEQEKEAIAKRRIGLGVTGLADALVMLKIPYGSDEAVAQTESWMQDIAREAYLASVELAKEKGSFPLLDVEKLLAPGTFASDIGYDIRQRIRANGLRNALLTSIAPTGTISLYAGNVSSGIEPIFAFEYDRKVTQKDGTKTIERVEDYAVQVYRQLHGDGPLPDYFVSAQTLAPLEHVKMQAAAQKWVDSSISKTINCPADISFEAFKTVYLEAWDTGCKGCTTYRPNEVTGSVLSVADDKPTLSSTADNLAARAETLSGKTYKIKWPEMPHAFYVTINDDLDGKPFEILITTQNVEAQPWIAGLTRMISAVFRRKGELTFVAEELQQIYDPRGGHWMKGKYVKSLLSAIGDVIATHTGAVQTSSGSGATCPQCGEGSLVKQSGCENCTSCGFSRCG